MAVVAGLAAFALLLRRDEARKANQTQNANEGETANAPIPARPLDQGGDWGLVTDAMMRDLARGPDLLSMQERAAEQIDAAEHAFNRLLADCAAVGFTTVAPTFEPARQLVREAAVHPQQQQAA